MLGEMSPPPSIPSPAKTVLLVPAAAAAAVAAFDASSRAQIGPPATIAADPAIMGLGVWVSGPSFDAPGRRERAAAGPPAVLSSTDTGLARAPLPAAESRADDRTERRSGSEAVRRPPPREKVLPFSPDSGAVPRLVLPPLFVWARPPQAVVAGLSSAGCGHLSALAVLVHAAGPARDSAKPAPLLASMAVKMRRTSLSNLSWETRVWDGMGTGGGTEKHGWILRWQIVE